MLHAVLLFVHLAAVMAWMGGMFFAYFCLRPVAAELLAPPQRLPLWAGVLKRFLDAMVVAVLGALATGGAMLADVGLRQASVGWHVMMGLGLVMAAVFADIRLRLFPRLQAHCAGAEWPAAGQALNGIRQRVALNLALGVVVVAAAASAR